MQTVKSFLRDESGLETVEWAIMVALIVLGCVLVLGTIGGLVRDKFQEVEAALGGQ